jgi:hypothetical protein
VVTRSIRGLGDGHPRRHGPEKIRRKLNPLDYGKKLKELVNPHPAFLLIRPFSLLLAHVVGA